jgi:hypothetical protein
MPSRSRSPILPRLKLPAEGSDSLHAGRCRFDGQIVQPACMPKERFPRRVFSAEIFSQLRGN